MQKTFTQEEMMQLLDKLYVQAVHGIEKVSPPVDMMVGDYLMKNGDVPSAANQFIRNQIAKCTTSGFLTGLGGIITLPVAIPANIGSVLYVQMRMITGLAIMGGYDTKSDQVQTLVYACLAGVSLDQLLKKAGIEFGAKLANAMIKKIPGTVLAKINHKVGFKLITKFGSKGIINLGKMVPGVAGVVGGAFDFVETKTIANRAYKMFIEEDFYGVGDADETDEITADYEIIHEE